MDAFNAYKRYLAIKSHFTNKSYDYFKYNGRSRASLKTFEQRRDRYYFEKLSNKKDIDGFLVANFIEDESVWVGDLVNEELAEKNYRHWRKRLDSLTYIFTNEIDLLEDCYNSNISVSEGQYPNLLKLHLRKQISPETLLILNDLTPFFNSWNRRINDKVLWPIHHHKLKKYRPFFTIDLDKFKQVVLKKFSKGS